MAINEIGRTARHATTSQRPRHSREGEQHVAGRGLSAAAPVREKMRSVPPARTRNWMQRPRNPVLRQVHSRDSESYVRQPVSATMDAIVGARIGEAT